MFRTFKNILACATWALLAAGWHARCLAQDASNYSAPTGSAAASGYYIAPPGNVPYSNIPGAPTQPMPAIRPSTWPGATAAPAQSPVYPQASNPAAGPVATVASAQPPLYPQTNYPPASYSPVNPGVQQQFYNPQMPQQMVQPYPNATGQPNPNAIGQPNPNAPVQPYPTGSAPQSNADMQSLQVLPGPREDYEDGRVVARVGSMPILAGDVWAMINQMLHAKGTVPKSPEEQKEAYRYGMRPVLKRLVQIKMVVNDAKQTVPVAGITKIEADLNHEFDKKEIPKLMKSYGVSGQHELDEALRACGSSLDWERRAYMDIQLMYGWQSQQIKLDEQVPLSDVVGYYQQHLADYEFPAQARWEELMVSFDKFPDKGAAWAAIAEMGNQVMMQGAPWADVAKARSQGFTADQGGVHDWTTQGSLATKTLDDALFNLPVGTFSHILESDRGYHIIRVVERKDAGRKSFEDAQADIKKDIKEANLKKQFDKWMAELQKKTPV